MKFSEFNGTKSTFFIKGYLDRIVTNNKTEKEHIITVKYLDKEELYRSFQLRNLDRKLVAQVNDTLIPDDTYEPLKEYDNYTQVSFSEFTQNDVDPDKKTLLSSHVIQIKN